MRSLCLGLGAASGVVLSVVLFDEVFQHRENGVDVNLLPRPKHGLHWDVAFGGLGEREGNSCDILRKQIPNGVKKKSTNFT